MSEVASLELPQAQPKRVAALVNSPDGGGPVALRTDQGEVELPPTARTTVRQLLADLIAGTAVHLPTDDSEWCDSRDALMATPFLCPLRSTTSDRRLRGSWATPRRRASRCEPARVVP